MARSATAETEPLWDVDQLCEFLNVPRPTFYRWRTMGTAPPAFVVGRQLRFRPSDVEKWLAERKSEASGE